MGCVDNRRREEISCIDREHLRELLLTASWMDDYRRPARGQRGRTVRFDTWPAIGVTRIRIGTPRLTPRTVRWLSLIHI